MMHSSQGETLVHRAAEKVPWWSVLAGLLPLTIMFIFTLLVIFWLMSRRSCSAGYNDIMSPDTVSSLFPDRPIRPLPKRRLRERLSPDVAGTIQYPPEPASTTPLFYYPYNLKDEEQEHASRERGALTLDGSHVTRDTKSDQNESGARRGLAGRPSTNAASRSSARPLPKQDQERHPNPQASPSRASSADGYDSFENTNNKKKRKIPTAGDVSLNGGHSLGSLDPGGTSLTASSPSKEVHGPPGISGPGRGRYGRSRNGRSPLRALSDASSNWAGRNGKLRLTQWPSQPGENTGIISNAIANANAEKPPSHHGQENVSLLQQQQPTKPGSASTQFTFTPQAPGNLAWPGSDPKSSTIPLHQQGQSAPVNWPQGRTRSDHPTGPATIPTMTAQGVPVPPVDGAAKGGNPPRQPIKKKKKTRSQLNKELDDQARERKREQETRNLQSQPNDGEFYICPFCEFESINGYKPKTLIRVFEMKERKKRLEAERRQRLLEKAKARGRKGKKGRMPPKNNNLVDSQPQSGQHGPAMNHLPSEEIRSDGYDDDDYGDDGEEYGLEESHLENSYSGNGRDQGTVANDLNGDPDGKSASGPESSGGHHGHGNV